MELAMILLTPLSNNPWQQLSTWTFGDFVNVATLAWAVWQFRRITRSVTTANPKP